MQTSIEQQTYLNTNKSQMQKLNNALAFLLAFCCLTPSFSLKTSITMAIIVMWFASIIIGKYMINALNSTRVYMYLGLLGFLLITIIIIVIRPDMNSGGLYTGLLTSVICLETLRNNLINRDVSALKNVALFSIVIYVLVLARALIIGGTNTDVYRLNKSSGVMNETIGNFGIYYSAVFTFPIGMFFLINKKSKKKILSLALMGVSFVLLIFAQYTISFIVEISILLIWLILAKTKDDKRLRILLLILIAVFIIVLVMFAEELLAQPLTSLVETLPKNSPIRQRLADVIRTLRGDITEGNLAVDRLTRYRDSMVNFLKNPLLGSNVLIALGGDASYLVGKPGHNSLIEIFSQYGLIFALPYYIAMFSLLNRMLKVWKKVYRKFYVLMVSIVTGYFLLALLNPIFNLFAMTWLIFNAIILLPLVFCDKQMSQKVYDELRSIGKL